MPSPYSIRVALLVAALALCGCTTAPPHASDATSPVEHDTAGDPITPLARASYLSDGSLHLEVDSAGTVSHLATTSKRRATDTLPALSVPPGQKGIPPILALTALPAPDWRPEAGTPVPVFGLEMWNQLQEGIRLIVTPREPGYGAVVDLLNEQDLFHYYDEIGTLRTVPIAYKPDDIRVKATYSFEEVVKNSLPAVGQVKP